MEDSSWREEPEDIASSGVGRMRNLPSRIFHCLLAVAFFILLLLTLSAIGTTAGTYDEIRDNSYYGKSTSDGGLNGKAGTCILYARFPCSKVDRYPCLSDDTSCQFAISGNGIIGLVSLLLIVVSVVKAVLGWSAFSPIVLFDLALVIPAFVIGMAASGVISGGLATTCTAFRDASGDNANDIPCCIYTVPKTSSETSSDNKIYFYEPLNAAQVISWTATIVLFAIMSVDLVLLVLFAIRRSVRGRMQTYIPQEDDPTAPPSYSDNSLPDVAAEYK